MLENLEGRRFDALVVAATKGELSWAGDVEAIKEASFGGSKVLFAVSGPGVANISFTLGKILAVAKPKLILCVGIGGAYRSSGLSAGDIAVATAEYDADWGIEPDGGSSVTGQLSIPRLTIGDVNYHEAFPVSLPHARKFMSAAGSFADACEGAFVTSSIVTSTVQRAEELEARFGAICENMEGAAAAQVALIAGIPFVEARGISNICGPRDLGTWKIKEAVDSVGRGALGFLESL